MILNGILANANLVGVLHHAGAGVGLVQLLRAVLLALRVRVRCLHRLVPLACDQLLLFLGALPVDLGQAAILLKLQLLRITAVIDVFHRGAWLLGSIAEKESSLVYAATLRP